MEKKTCFSIILLCLFFYMQGCTGKNDTDSTQKATGESKKAIKNFTLVETEGDQKKWVMEAESAEFKEIDAEQVIQIKKFKVYFYEDNQQQATLEAQEGIYNKNTERLITYGKVDIEAEEKTIVTKNVIWDPQRKLFVTDEEVFIKTADGVLRGKGMEATMDLKSIKLKEEIKGEIQDLGYK